MRAGKLDKRLTIVRFVETGRDGANQPIYGWSDVATLWAQARPVRGEERFQAQQLAGTEVMTFHIRYRADLTVKDRIRFKGKEWDITAVREIGRGVVSEFDCQARAE
ncbi:SPP1 family predicted phage head-tail adaptor [Rhizobium petrolearium]|uniref:phage head closure protein n=1 Tax=Neorhizobium petrolearium TaxID=515361 RepID=UPI001AE2B021|nr:phage head closure protein [Neorhizobium petrolearium]MBP1842006.1 SPP1 family predicted phage head-tail adaptor [Neorhizobium petrolearium]